MRPLCGNSEAVEILTYHIEAQRAHNLADDVARKIQTIYAQNEAEMTTTKVFMSGRRHYLCHVLPLDYGSQNPSAPTTAILFERTSEPTLQFSKIAQRFNLTLREKQTIELLIEGLSSKEIAERMGISPHTVKAFLHLIMTKMEVSSRTELVAK